MTDRAPWHQRLPERPFWIYFAASLFFNVGFAAYFFLYNVYLAQLGFSEARIGRVAAALSLGTVAGTLPVGYASSRFGIRRTLLVAIPLTATAAAARIVLPSYGAQLIFGFLTGAALCSWGVCLGPSVARLTSERTRPMAFSFLFAAGIGMAGVGSVVASHVPALLEHAYALGHTLAVRWTLVLGCLTTLASLLLLCVLELGPSQITPPVLQRPGRFLRRFLIGIALWGFVAGGFSTFAAVYFTRSLSVPLPRLGTIFFVAQIAQCAGVLIAPLLLRRFRFSTSVMATQLSAACAMALLAFAARPSHAAMFYWIYITATYMSEPALFTMLMDRIPAPERPQASSWHMLTASLTQSVTAVLIGAAITAAGYHTVLLGLAIAGAACGLLFYRIAAGDSDARTD